MIELINWYEKLNSRTLNLNQFPHTHITTQKEKKKEKRKRNWKKERHFVEKIQFSLQRWWIEQIYPFYFSCYSSFDFPLKLRHKNGECKSKISCTRKKFIYEKVLLRKNSRLADKINSLNLLSPHAVLNNTEGGFCSENIPLTQTFAIRDKVNTVIFTPPNKKNNSCTRRNLYKVQSVLNVRLYKVE